MIHFQENDASRDVPTKNEEVIKTDKFSLQQKKPEKFRTKDFSQMSRITIHSELIVNEIMKMMILTTTKGIKDMT